MTVEIMIGDVRDRLKAMPSECVDCVVTSPPYWGLRDYGVDGQIGLEPTLGEHLDVMVDVFREVRRVLKRHGTVWLNYGDCYATTPNGRAAADVEGDDRTFRDKPFSTVGPIQARSNGGEGQHHDRRGGYLKPKDLCMIPNRLAIALQEDGWWVRSEIIWHKPNPMPESVYDRPTGAHEKVFLLTKGESYFYNHEAIREPVTASTVARLAQDVENQKGSLRANGGTRADRPMKAVGPNSRMNVDRVPRSRKKPREDEVTTPQLAPDTRNARNVWTIAPKAFREAHFATFPPELARRCILAGTPPTVCSACGATDSCGGLCGVFGRAPGRVLDPFGGAGTVGLVAEELGFDSVLIELNPEYAEIARARIARGAAAESRVAA